MIRVAFINENSLGHASYLVPFVRTLEAHPEWGIAPHLIQATPLPPPLERRATRTIPVLRTMGLDFHLQRWRQVVSQYARSVLDEQERVSPFHAVVVNTQSAGLCLADWPRAKRVLVGLDATFSQLCRSPWFAPNRVARRLLFWTVRSLRQSEHRLIRRADRLLAWSPPVIASLESEYGCRKGKALLLPPSVRPSTSTGRRRHSTVKAKLLFVGGDFRRKGGELLVECFQKDLAHECELHVITQTPIPSQPGMTVHLGLRPGTPEWESLWQKAELFAFPSRLDTFGIAVLEALGFGIPVVAADVGAVRFVLAEGQAGLVIKSLNRASLTSAIRQVLADPVAAENRSRFGLEHVRRHFDLETNARRLAEWLRESTVVFPEKSF